MKYLYVICFIASTIAVENPALRSLINENKPFDSTFHKEVATQKPGNFIASSHSAQVILALAQLGARGNTSEQLRIALKLPVNEEETKASIRASLTLLQNHDGYNLSTVNKIYVKTGFTIRPEYQQLATDVFQSEIENLNFNEPEKAAKNINQWVEGKTNNKIKDIVSSKDLSTSTRLVLVNALYFQAKWASQFHEINTIDREFYNNGKVVVQVPTMFTTGYFPYYENAELNAKLIELPYKGNDVKLRIAIPNDKEGLAVLEDRLSELGELPKFENRRIELYIPKFQIKTDLDLLPILKNMGVKDIFDGQKSDLSGIADTTPDRLYITDVIQKAFINVTESGTEAAASTILINKVAAISHEPTIEPIEVKVDRPFSFYISHNESVNLFTGRITNL